MHASETLNAPATENLPPCCAGKAAAGPNATADHADGPDAQTGQGGDGHANHHGHGGQDTTIGTAFHATLHCLTGCIIGEVAGLLIGVSLGLHPFATMALSTALAYVSGFALAIGPLMHREGLSLTGAMKVVWLGEAISIAAMEVAMNGADYLVGGVQSGSVFSALFWIGLAAAIPAGFVAAFPVNYLLLKRQLKACH